MAAIFFIFPQFVTLETKQRMQKIEVQNVMI